MQYTIGGVNDAKYIAMVYLEAFPESIDMFFKQKKHSKLIELLTNAFALVLLTGAQVLVAQEPETQVLGYCIYSRPMFLSRRFGIILKNIGAICKHLIGCLTNINIKELAKLTHNALAMHFHTHMVHPLPKCGRINSIAVSPAAQGRGIGKELLRRALHELSDIPVFLSVRPNNNTAKHLYLKAGFRPIGTTSDLQGEWVLMLKD